MRLSGNFPLQLIALFLTVHTANLYAGTAGPGPTTYIVNTTEDVVDSEDKLEGSLTPKVSLREAIKSANGSTATDTITFDPAVFNTETVSGDSATGTQTILLDHGDGQLDLIIEDVVINGPADRRVIIDGNETSRIFAIASGVEVTMQDLILTKGNAVGAIGSGNGGAIYNQGDLTLLESSIAGNTASNNTDEVGFGGGGIYNTGTGTLTLGDKTDSSLGSDITDNSANGTAGSGGGILNNGGVVIMQNGALSRNRATRAGGAIEHTGGGSVSLSSVAMDSNRATGFTNVTANPGNGGGIHSGGAGQILFVNSSAVSNSASNEGGAIWAAATSGATMQLQASTISSNSALSGGGIFFDQGGDTATSCDGLLIVEHITLANNTASTADAGGGLFSERFCQPNIDNSILGNNTANSAANDLDGPIGTQVDAANSLIEIVGANVTLIGAGNNTTDTDPNLAALSTDVASGTRFHRLNAATIDDPDTTTDESLPASPAIDALTNGTCIGTDQRLLDREFDFDGAGSPDCDLGAIELNSDVFAALENYIDTDVPANSKNGKLFVVAQGDTDVQALAFKLTSKAIDETQNSPASVIQLNGFSGSVVIGTTGFLPKNDEDGVKLWLDNNNDGILDGADTDITSEITLTLNETDRTFEVKFNNANQTIDALGERGYIVTVDIPTVSVASAAQQAIGRTHQQALIAGIGSMDTTIPAGLIGLPIFALALLQRRRSLRIAMIMAGCLTLLTACGSDDNTDLTEPVANTTTVQTFQIKLTAIDAVAQGRAEVIRITPNTSVPGLLLHLTVPK